MRTQLAVLLIGVVSPGVWGQDSAAEKIPAHARLLILKKQVVAAAESERLEAVQELAGIEDDEAIVVLAAKLRTDTDAVRTAAAHAIAQHRKPASVQAIGMAVDVNLQKEAVLHAFIEALSELDLCKCLTPLGALVWANKYALAGEALEAIGKIGCPEAVPFLADLLRRAETEEKKPDVFESDEGSDENRNKNKVLAALVEKIHDTLGVVAGRNLPSARDWYQWLESDSGVKLTSLYYCPVTSMTYEVKFGQPKKCPHADGKSFHTDVFLKHQKE
ncbi:MAG TPA: hypothetical protein VKU80_13520 [Planctomycetota bacterium]|nr:hypothetical protein [Planctomycetota bacterium]